MSLRRAAMLSVLALLFAVRGAAAQEQGRRILVLGVAGTQTLAQDPSDRRSVAEFTHNFAQIVTLSTRDEGASGVADQLNRAADLGWSVFEDLRGVLSPPARRAFSPIRLTSRDTVIAHSWAAMAVMYAVRDGVLQSPGQLVVVNPPLISPEGAREWRAFAERFPQLALDVYIGTDDILHRIRVNDASGRVGRYSPGDALLPFLVPEAPARIRVRMYPGDHALLGFMDFASRAGEYGLRPRAVGGGVEIPGSRTPDFMRAAVFKSDGIGYRYLFETGPGMARAQAMARAFGIGREPQTRELRRARLDERAARSAAELSRARWEFAALLVSIACDAPYALREFESRGLVPSLRMPLSDLRLGYERARGSMSKCERELFEELIANPRGFGVLALADRGERYRREHNPVRLAQKEMSRLLNSIARAFAEPVEKFVDFLTAPSLSSSSERGVGGDGWSGGGERERDSPGFTFNSPTFEQLKSGNIRW